MSPHSAIPLPIYDTRPDWASPEPPLLNYDPPPSPPPQRSVQPQYNNKTVWQNMNVPVLKLCSWHSEAEEHSRERERERETETDMMRATQAQTCRFLRKVTRLFKGRPTDLAGDKQLLELPG